MNRFETLGLRLAVIGAQRAGSTYLSTLLDRCPTLDLPYLELPIFESPYFEGSEISEIERAYSKQGAVVRGIKRPNLLGQPKYGPRLRSAGIELVVATLRDPVDRLVSAVHWYMYIGLIEVDSASATLERLLASARRDLLVGRERELVVFSMYGQHLSRWLDIFGPNGLMVMDDKFVRHSPEIACTQILRRLTGNSAFVLPDNLAEFGRRNENVYSTVRLKWLERRLRYAVGWEDGSVFKLDRSGNRISNSKYNRVRVAAVHSVDRAILRPLLKNEPIVNSGLRAEWDDFYSRDQLALAELRKVLPGPE